MDDLVLFDTKEVTKIIKGLGDAAGDMSPTMEILAEQLVSEVSDTWDTAGHGTWPDLADSTKAHRRGTSYEILKDTGRAAQSVNPVHGPDFAEASTDVDYMKFHVGDAPRTKIPKRDPFVLTDEAVDRARDFLLEALVSKSG